MGDEPFNPPAIFPLILALDTLTQSGGLKLPVLGSVSGAGRRVGGGWLQVQLIRLILGTEISDYLLTG